MAAIGTPTHLSLHLPPASSAAAEGFADDLHGVVVLANARLKGWKGGGGYVTVKVFAVELE